MKNITLAIDEDVLAKARAVAEKRGTTVNAMVREHLTQLATEEERWSRSKERLRLLMDTSTADIGPGFKWSRDMAYDD